MVNIIFTFPNLHNVGVVIDTCNELAGEAGLTPKWRKFMNN